MDNHDDENSSHVEDNQDGDQGGSYDAAFADVLSFDTSHEEHGGNVNDSNFNPILPSESNTIIDTTSAADMNVFINSLESLEFSDATSPSKIIALINRLPVGVSKMCVGFCKTRILKYTVQVTVNVTHG